MYRWSMSSLLCRFHKSLFSLRHTVRPINNRTQLAFLSLEDRFVPDAVGPGGSWNDGHLDQYGNLVGITVTLNNGGPGWLDVSGGGGSVSVTPGAPRRVQALAMAARLGCLAPVAPRLPLRPFRRTTASFPAGM